MQKQWVNSGFGGWVWSEKKCVELCRKSQTTHSESLSHTKCTPHQFGWLNLRLNVCVCCIQHDNTNRNVIYMEYYVCSRRFAIHCHAINMFVRNSHHLIWKCQNSKEVSRHDVGVGGGVWFKFITPMIIFIFTLSARQSTLWHRIRIIRLLKHILFKFSRLHDILTN